MPEILRIRVTTLLLLSFVLKSSSFHLLVSSSSSLRRLQLPPTRNLFYPTVTKANKKRCSKNSNLYHNKTRRIIMSGKEDEFGDASMLIDFDPDEFIKNMQNEKALQNSKVGVHNHPYAKNNDVRSNSSPSSGEPVRATTTSSSFESSLPSATLSPPSLKKQKLENKSIPTDTVINPTTVSNYTQTLTKYFGYKSFRNGQLQIIHSIISNHNTNDACVFWSTGSGKSLCYQIPPLYMKKIAIVVSPLISLMEDQVSKLNGLFLQEGKIGHTATKSSTSKKKDMAIYLGSGQMDMNADSKALTGEYSFVYCTPEKMLSQDGSFLDSLGFLHQREHVCSDNGITDSYGSNICLIAIDESHCVSEWGHDFRPEYRSLGEKLRSHPILSTIPILALTATAIPRVQNDIISSLQLRNPKISQQSFDRSNLVISIKRKPSGAYRTALQPFVTDLTHKYNKTKETGGIPMGNDSTIIYCPTRRLVEDIAKWLSAALEKVGIKVEAYHAGLSTQKRSDAHVNFLTGKTMIIVATIAFGMGIDKPDTRRVIHYGPPKNVEEYYQQIGRAGRDGLDAYCTMFADAGDFDSYKDDFYLGKLGADAKLMQTQSIDALKRYALSDEVCRRAELLKFFGEQPAFGERCGTCDTCQMRRLHAGDEERDFAKDGARVVLYAISTLNGKQGSSIIEKILRGSGVESYRYSNNGCDASSVSSKILTMREGMKKRVPMSYFTKDLLPALVDRGFVEMNSQTSTYGNRNATWTGYKLTVKGWSALDSGTIVLPVPASVREWEEKQKTALQESLKNLQDAGVNIGQIPKQELEDGEGEVLTALKTWHNYLDSCHRQQRSERVDELEDLRLRLDAWRSDMAVRFRMSPADVMPEHLMLKVAYAAASLKTGTLEREALLQVGVRSGGIDDLELTITSWLEETRKNNDSSLNRYGSTDPNVATSCQMILLEENFKPSKPWDFFVYKPNKKSGLAAWESSYNRFMAGEHIQTIAMSPVNGRPIQVSTVVAHIFDGLVSGREVNLRRLNAVQTFPNKAEWERLEEIEKESGIDVTANPDVSGKDGGPFRMTDFLTPVMGPDFASKEFSDRTEEEKAIFNKWCSLLKCYISFRRSGYKPCFEEQMVLTERV